METTYIGKPISRVDGPKKVSGAAKYAGEFNVPDLAYGYVVSSAIAKGKIISINSEEVEKTDGVLKVFTHENVKGLSRWNRKYKDDDAPPGDHFRFLQTDDISYSMQPVALVVAETFEQARYAASLIKVEYQQEEPITDLLANLDKAQKPKGTKTGFKAPKNKGKFEKGFDKSAVQLTTEYFHGAEHHNPMEMHASTVVYEGKEKLRIYDKTQGILNSQTYVCNIFGLKKKNVQAFSPFVGGGFGSGLRPQYQLFMAALAALELERSVRVTLTRQQMFSFGHRPVAQQYLSIGANEDGLLQAMSHSAVAETSMFEDYMETTVNWSGMLYKCDNVALDYKLVHLNMYTPLDMRAPGAVTGVYALECAMDEMAYKLKMDPLQFRLQNYSEKDNLSGHEYTSKALRQCYEQAAEKFGWSKRNPEPRSMKRGSNVLVGQGMATGMWDAMVVPTRATATFSKDGKLVVGSATADIGTGTYTIMTQIAAETLGISMDNVTFRLGDASLPYAFLEGGSSTAASVGTAVMKVCQQIKEELFSLAKKVDNTPFTEPSIEDYTFDNGEIYETQKPSVRITYAEIMEGNGKEKIDDTTTMLPDMLKTMGKMKNTHSAVFVEVEVDEDFGTVTVTRVVNAIAAGRIINPKTARSQVLGGIVWGISQALHEDSFMDHNFGRFMNHNYAEYHIPVNKDIHDIEVIFVKEDDERINPLGVKGVGEIGQVGVASAVCNAIFHATGKRVKDLPVTLDKLL